MSTSLNQQWPRGHGQEALLGRSRVDLDFHTAVGLQAGDQRIAILIVVAGLHRLAFAPAFGTDAGCIHAIVNQVLAHGPGATLRQQLIVGIAAHTVGVAHHADGRVIRLLQLRRDGGQ